jgi:nicotinamide-nucleotide amidase
VEVRAARGPVPDQPQLTVSDRLIELATQLQARCVELGLTVATAESCTGGLVAHALTEVPGSSAYVRGGIVAYANDVKAELLGVPVGALDAHGAVSAQVAVAMAEGARDRLRADLGVAVTGVAGPDGGTDEKPVGLVYVGLSDAGGTFAERLDLSAWARSRDALRERSANRAFDLLRLRLEERKRA